MRRGFRSLGKQRRAHSPAGKEWGIPDAEPGGGSAKAHRGRRNRPAALAFGIPLSPRSGAGRPRCGAQPLADTQNDLAKDAPELTFRVLELRNTSPYWEVASIEWPMRLFPVRTVDDDGYIVFPEEQGFIVPSRFDQGYFRYLNWIWERMAGFAFVAQQTSMPWFGAKKGQISFMCIIETPDDVAYGVIANDVRAPDQPSAPPSAVPGPNTALQAPRLSAIWPYWQSVKGELGYSRVARYIFQPHGGYVEMCKTYRKYSQKSGKFVTLKQKIAANPEVAKLIGAPNFEIHVVANRAREPQYLTLSGPVTDGAHQLQTTFDQIEAMVKDMHNNLHLDRALIRIAGWGGRGYDNDRPIDSAIVNEEAGGSAKLARAIAAAKQAGYLGGLWDDYREMEVNAPVTTRSTSSAKPRERGLSASPRMADTRRMCAPAKLSNCSRRIWRDISAT